MVRKIRYRQVLRNRHSQKGRYLKEVSQQKSFWKEDKAPTPTIERVREIHSSLGTWDKLLLWNRREDPWGNIKNMLHYKGTNIYLYGLHPKYNYKYDHKYLISLGVSPLKLKKPIWKEQERRTLEFFEREGC